jgi:hypothetical protein
MAATLGGFAMTTFDTQDPSRDPLIGEIQFGLLGGLVSTLVMDLFMIGLFAASGKPLTVFFSFIGDAARALLILVGIGLSKSELLGVLLHYFIGLSLGLIFGVMTQRLKALHGAGIIKYMVVAVIYTELASMVLLIPAVLLLTMSAAEIMELFAFAIVFHAVWGGVLGFFVKRSLRTDRIAGV